MAVVATFQIVGLRAEQSAAYIEQPKEGLPVFVDDVYIWGALCTTETVSVRRRPRGYIQTNLGLWLELTSLARSKGLFVVQPPAVVGNSENTSRPALTDVLLRPTVRKAKSKWRVENVERTLFPTGSALRNAVYKGAVFYLKGANKWPSSSEVRVVPFFLVLLVDSLVNVDNCLTCSLLLPLRLFLWLLLGPFRQAFAMAWPTKRFWSSRRYYRKKTIVPIPETMAKPRAKPTK